MRPPRVLYKYVISDRLDILERKKIRFTQPAAFNDIFESYPFIGDLPSAGSVQDSVDEIFRANNRGQCVRPEVMQSAFVFTLLNKVGVLALTEDPVSALMWARYANNHDGYVIGFDTTHNFFQPGPPYDLLEDRITLDELRPVEYRSRRPETGFPLAFGDDALFIKSPDWAYEREWRIRKHLEGATEVLQEKAAFPVYLFDLPPSAISEIVIGCRMQSIARSKLLEAIASRDYRHVKVLEVWPHPTEFGMQLLPYDQQKAMTKNTKHVITDVPLDRVEQTIQMWANMGAAQIDKIRQPDGKWMVVVLLRE